MPMWSGASGPAGLAAGLAGTMICLLSTTAAHAKTPGAIYCYNGVCHRVLTLSETAAAVGRVEIVKTSHYGAPGEDPYNPRSETSSGEPFDPQRDDNVASPIYPDGTVLLIRLPETRQAAVARVNNAGPYFADRLLDLSTALAHRLGLAERGVMAAEVTPLQAPTEDLTEYKRGRSYPKVAGYLGAFGTLEQALLALPEPDAVLALRRVPNAAPDAGAAGNVVKVAIASASLNVPSTRSVRQLPSGGARALDLKVAENRLRVPRENAPPAPPPTARTTAGDDTCGVFGLIACTAGGR